MHLCVCSPVAWGCRIHRLLFCLGVRPPPTSILIMTLNHLMASSSHGDLGNVKNNSLPFLPGLICSGVVAPDRVLSMGQIELFNYLNRVQTNY